MQIAGDLKSSQRLFPIPPSLLFSWTQRHKFLGLSTIPLFLPIVRTYNWLLLHGKCSLGSAFVLFPSNASQTRALSSPSPSSALSQDLSPSCWINLPKHLFHLPHPRYGPKWNLSLAGLSPNSSAQHSHRSSRRYCFITLTSFPQRVSVNPCVRQHRVLRILSLHPLFCLLNFFLYPLLLEVPSFLPEANYPTSWRRPLLHKTFPISGSILTIFDILPLLELGTEVLHQSFFLKGLLGRNMECRLFVYSYYHQADLSKQENVPRVCAVNVQPNSIRRPRDFQKSP